MEFTKALQSVFGSEGGFSDHPDDHGGRTNFGITQSTYDDWAAFKKVAKRDVALITKEEAASIYYKFYWLDGKCDLLPKYIALMHFDMCVNAGIGQAAKLLQRSCRVTEDGVIGPKTLATIASIKDVTLMKRYAVVRINFYHSLTDDPTQRKFWLSWLNRSINTLSDSYEEYWKSTDL